MQIGSLTLELVDPVDLDAQLLAVTGCSAGEVREHLAGAAIAGHIAAALAPFVKLDGETGPPSRIALAQAIAAEDVVAVRAQVLELYDRHLGIDPPPVPEHLAGMAEQPAPAAPQASPPERKVKTSVKAKG